MEAPTLKIESRGWCHFGGLRVLLSLYCRTRACILKYFVARLLRPAFKTKNHAVIKINFKDDCEI